MPTNPASGLTVLKEMITAHFTEIENYNNFVNLSQIAFEVRI